MSAAHCNPAMEEGSSIGSEPARMSGAGVRSLLQFLRSGTLEDSGSQFQRQSWDWRAFAEACGAHQLTPFVYCRLQSLRENAVPPGLLEYLRERSYEITANNYRLADRLVSLTSRLRSEGIPTLAYKGPAVAMSVYGGLTRRQYQDLDMVVHKEHLAKTATLLTSWGFRPTPTPALPQLAPYLCDPNKPSHLARGQEIPFCAPDKTYYVDIHWQLGDLFWRSFSPAVERLWERADTLNLPQGNATSLCREDLFLALCAHGTRHRWVHLKWLVDVAELLRGSETMDWARVEKMVGIRPRTTDCVRVAVTLVHELLGADLPAQVERIFLATRRSLMLARAIQKEIVRDGQSSGDEHATLLALQSSAKERARYRIARTVRYPEALFRQAIVEISDKDRNFVRLPPGFQFLYHVVRPARLVATHGRRVAHSLRRYRPG